MLSNRNETLKIYKTFKQKNRVIITEEKTRPKANFYHVKKD